MKPCIMKNIKLFIAIIVAFFALTQAKSQSYNFDNPVRINSWMQLTQSHPGTNANRLLGVSAAGPGVTGSFVNYVTVGSGLTLSGGTLSASGVSPADSSNNWRIFGNTLAAPRKIGSLNAYGVKGITNNIVRWSIDSATSAIMRIGVGTSLSSLQTTAAGQAHLATAGSYTIRSTAGPITLQATGSEGVAIGAATTGGKKLYVLGDTYLEGNLRIADGTENNGYVLTSDANGNATWQAAGGGGFWTQNGGKLYPTTLTDSVGIGTNAPEYRFHVTDSIQGSVFRPLLQVGYDGTEPYAIIGNRHQTGDSLNYMDFPNTDFNIVSKTGSNTINIAGRTLGQYYFGVGNTGGEIFRVDGTTGSVGVGTSSPTSKLTVTGGDIAITDVGSSGILMFSPDGTRYRVTVANGGTIAVTAAP